VLENSNCELLVHGVVALDSGGHREQEEKGFGGGPRGWVLNHHLNQKLKVIGNYGVNYFINILILSLTCGFKLPINK
jgi:hypothetical protein